MYEHILNKFFEPEKVALIGATRTPGFGYGIPGFWKRHGWLEKAYLVNPKGGEIEGKPVLRSISELPDGIDLAVLMVPAKAVKGAIKELGEKGVKALVIESAGFAETGAEGKREQEEISKLACQFGMRLLGPNCVGVVNTELKFATIEIMDQALEKGEVGIIAQSGVFGNILLDHLPALGIRVSKVATLGNKIDLDEADFLEYFAQDPKIKVILLYEEGIQDGRRLIAALKYATEKKPVLVLKSGRTEFGKRATLSHTGSLSGEDLIYEGAFRQAGAIRASNLQELLYLAKAFTSQPSLKGKRIGVLTTSGSMGAMLSDALFEMGFELAEWSVGTLEKIKQVAPGWVNLKNPLDVGPSGIFGKALDALFSDPNPDGFVLIPVIPFAAIEPWRAIGFKMRDFFGEISKLRERVPDKPVITVLLGYEQLEKEMEELCGNAITVVHSPEMAVRVLAGLSAQKRLAD